MGESGRPALDHHLLGRLTGTPPLVWQLSQVTRQAAASPILALAGAALTGREPQIPGGQDDVTELQSSIPEPLLEELLHGRATVVAFSNLAVAVWNRRVRQLARRPEAGPSTETASF